MAKLFTNLRSVIELRSAKGGSVTSNAALGVLVIARWRALAAVCIRRAMGVAIESDEARVAVGEMRNRLADGREALQKKQQGGNGADEWARHSRPTTARAYPLPRSIRRHTENRPGLALVGMLHSRPLRTVLKVKT